MGRVLCPEDLHDWTVLSIQVDGIYQLPQKLLEAGGPLPEPGTAEGPLESHPLRYHLRLLGCEFKEGQLILPHVELPPETTDDPTDAPEAEAEESVPATPATPEDVSFDIGMEEFQEALMRAGFADAKVDGPELFGFLCRPRTGLGGRLGLQDFLRLEEIVVPAPVEKLLQLHSFLLEKHETLEMAFTNMDAAAEGALTRESFAVGLEELAPDDLESLFVALDASRSGYISREDLRILAVTKRMSELDSASKAMRWLVAACGSLQKLLQQVDDQRSGRITRESFISTAERLGLVDTSGLEVAFNLACGEGGARLLNGDLLGEALDHESFLSLAALESDAAAALLKLEDVK